MNLAVMRILGILAISVGLVLLLGESIWWLCSRRGARSSKRVRSSRRVRSSSPVRASKLVRSSNPVAAAAKHRVSGSASEPEDKSWQAVQKALSGLAMYTGCEKVAEPVNELKKIAYSFEPIGRSKLLIMILGEFSSGKSSFINALLGEKVLATKIRPTTAAISRLTYGEKKQAVLHYRDGRMMEMPIEASSDVFNITAMGSKTMTAEELKQLSYVELRLDNPILKNMDIVDTPGFNSGIDWHTEMTQELVGSADVVFWVFSALKAAARTEIDLLKAQAGKPQCRIAVVNQMDRIPVNDDRVKAEERILQEIPRALFREVFFVSSKVPVEVGKDIYNKNIDRLKEFVQQEILPRKNEYQWGHRLGRLKEMDGMAKEVIALLEQEIKAERACLSVHERELAMLTKFYGQAREGQRVWAEYLQEVPQIRLLQLNRYFADSIDIRELRQVTDKLKSRRGQLAVRLRKLEILKSANDKTTARWQRENKQYEKLRTEYENSTLSGIADSISNLLFNSNFTDAKDKLDAAKRQVDATKAELDQEKMKFDNALEQYEMDKRVFETNQREFLEQEITRAVSKQKKAADDALMRISSHREISKSIQERILMMEKMQVYCQMEILLTIRKSVYYCKGRLQKMDAALPGMVAG